MSIFNNVPQPKSNDVKVREKLLKEIKKACRKTAPNGRQHTFSYPLIDFPDNDKKNVQFVLSYLKFVKSQVKGMGKGAVRVLSGERVDIYTYKLDAENLDLSAPKERTVKIPEIKIHII